MNIHQKNAILKVRGDVNISVERVVVENEPNFDTSELLNMIYSKDSRNGWPCNDIELQETKKLSPEVRIAIEKQNRFIPNNEVSSVDDDSVLDGVQKVNETDDEYSLRMHNLYKSD